METLNRDDSWISKEKLDQIKYKGQDVDSNPTYWHQSQLGQKLEFIVYWGYSISKRINAEDPYLLDQRNMPVHTTRSRAFSHWLNARNKSEIIVRFLSNLEKPEFILSSKGLYKWLGDWNYRFRVEREENQDTNQCGIYLLASKAMQNFFHALEYSRILTDNEHSLTFTHPGLVFFDMWKLLRHLVEFE